jgi:hypothetical protein
MKAKENNDSKLGDYLGVGTNGGERTKRNNRVTMIEVLTDIYENRIMKPLNLI